MKRMISIAILVAGVASLRAATVTGKVVDERKRPLPGATVWVQIRPDTKSHPKPFSVSSRSGRDGAFSMAGVPAGQFIACVQYPDSPYVDGCAWDVPRTFALTDNGALDLGALELREGHEFRVRIDDPRGELDQIRKAGTKPDLRIGLWTAAGFFYPLPLKREQPNSREYTAVVPYDVPFRLTAQTEKVQLAGERGKPVDGQKAFTVKRGNEPPVFHLEITGIAQR